MNIDRHCYIYILNTHSSGVIQKIRHHLLTAENLKLEMDWYIFGDESVRQSLDDLLNLERLNFQILPEVSSKFGRLRRRLFKYRLVDKTVPWHLYKAAVIRYAWSIDPYALIFFWRRGRMLFTEHNTLELHELSTMSYFGKLGPLLGFLESLISPWTLSQVRGSVAVTSEIALDLKKRCGVRSIQVIANGVQDKSILPRHVKEGCKKLIFVGSPGMNWHGRDRIIELAKLLTEFQFYLVGESESLSQNLSLPNVKYYDKLDQDQLDELIANCDAGFGTMALERKLMVEACPLKVRNYLSLGVPVIINYWDTDLSGNGLDFVLQLPKVYDSLDEQAELIRKFLGSNPKNKYQNKLREFVTDKLDWKVKFEQLVEYLRSETTSKQL